jgi:hypothetical protein
MVAFSLYRLDIFRFQRERRMQQYYAVRWKCYPLLLIHSHNPASEVKLVNGPPGSWSKNNAVLSVPGLL